MTGLEQALIDFALALITAAGPVLIAFVVAWVKAKTDEIKSNIKENLNYTQQNALDWAVKTAVNAAEQSGLTNAIANTITNKKELAISIAQNLLKSRGIDIDLKSIADAIEAAVWTELNSPASDVAKAVSLNATEAGQPVVTEVVKSDQVSPN